MIGEQFVVFVVRVRCYFCCACSLFVFVDEDYVEDEDEHLTLFVVRVCFRHSCSSTNTNNEHHELFADHYCLPTSLPHHQGCSRGGVGGPPRYMFSIYLCHSGLGIFLSMFPPTLGASALYLSMSKKTTPDPPGIWNSIYVLVFPGKTFLMSGRR